MNEHQAIEAAEAANFAADSEDEELLALLEDDHEDAAPEVKADDEHHDAKPAEEVSEKPDMKADTETKPKKPRKRKAAAKKEESPKEEADTKADTGEPKVRVNMQVMRPSQALDALFGESLPDFLVLRKDDAKLKGKDRDESVRTYLNVFDNASKKEREKIINVFVGIAQGKEIRKYTQMAMDLLVQKKKIKASDIREMYSDAGLKTGTVNSVTNQMMHILKYLEMASFDSMDNTLNLNADSTIYAALYNK